MISMKRAYSGQPGVADTTLYTCPSNINAKVIKCTLTNDTSTPVTLTMHKVPAGESVGDSYLILNGKVLGDSETYDCPEVSGQVLNAGDIISAVASVANQVSVALDVVEMT